MFHVIWTTLFLTALGPISVYIQSEPFATREACEQWNRVRVVMFIGRGTMPAAVNAECVRVDERPGVPLVPDEPDEAPRRGA